MSPGTSAVELHKGRAKIVHCEQKGKNFWMDSLRSLPQRDAIGGSDTSLPFLCYQPALSRQTGTSLFPSGSGSCQRSWNLSGQWPIADHSDTFFFKKTLRTQRSGQKPGNCARRGFLSPLPPFLGLQDKQDRRGRGCERAGMTPEGIVLHWSPLL